MDDALAAANTLLFFATQDEPAPHPVVSMQARELKRINDWNGALRQSGGISGEVRGAQFTSSDRPCASDAARARHRECARRR